MEIEKINGRRSRKSVPRQIFLAILANFSNIAPGMNIGFSAVAIPTLKNLNSGQISWFASIASLATPFGCILSGPIADKFGRKWSIAIVNIISLIGWIIIVLAYYLNEEEQYRVLLVGRVLTGLSAGLCGSPASVYMAEVASADMRSVFTTWVSLFYAIGIFLVYLLGLILQDDWSTIALIAATCSLIGIFILRFFIPESPPWLVTKHRFEDAKRNLCKLHGTKDCTQDVLNELEILINGNVKKEKLAQKRPLNQQFMNKMKLLTKKSFLRPYRLVATFFFFQQFSGIFVIMYYAIDIVEEAKIEMNSYIVIVLIAIVRLIAMVVLSFCSRYFGRRPLSLISGIGIFLTMISLGTFTLMVHKEQISQEDISSLSIIPLVLLVSYFFISTLGFYAIPFAYASEIYPSNLRGTAAGLSTATTFFFNFIIAKLYPTMRHAIGAYGVFYFFGIIGAIGTIFVFFCLPETKGKSLEEIQKYFNKKKSNNTKTNDEIEEEKMQLKMHKI